MSDSMDKGNTEKKEAETKEEEESFADLFESYSIDRSAELRVGEKINAEIISIGRDAVFVDTGAKIDGVVEMADLLDGEDELPYSLGDRLDLYVIAVSESKIELSPGLSGIGGQMRIEEAWNDGTPIEGTVQGQVKGGFNVNVMGKRAFCPISQIDLNYVEKPEAYIGQTYSFLIITYEEDGRNIVISRKDILRAEAEKASQSFYENAAIGNILEGKITRIESYGAFVEIAPTIEGMVHISELSWSKNAKPIDIVKIGDRVQVKLIGMAQNKSNNRLKISLSVKQISEDPWNAVADKIKPGDKVKGTVTRCMDFGAFVELLPGIEGLVHISEMSYTKRILKPEEVVSEGETVSVIVREIDTIKRRISLSLRDAQGDPWIEVPEKYKIGQSINGTVENKESFGFFVQLEPGVTGLLPKSKIADSYDAAAIEKLKEGDSITVLVEELNVDERKITLGPGDSAGMKNWESYSSDRGQSLGALGEKLKEALAKNQKR